MQKNTDRNGSYKTWFGAPPIPVSILQGKIPAGGKVVEGPFGQKKYEGPLTGRLVQPDESWRDQLKFVPDR